MTYPIRKFYWKCLIKCYSQYPIVLHTIRNELLYPEILLGVFIMCYSPYPIVLHPIRVGHNLKTTSLGTLVCPYCRDLSSADLNSLIALFVATSAIYFSMGSKYLMSRTVFAVLRMESVMPNAAYL